MSELTDKLLKMCEKYAFQYALTDSASVQFEKGVREACEQNYCGRYGKSWTCPPGAGELGELEAKMKKYKNVVVFTTKYDIEDSYDYEGMMSAGREHMKIQDIFADAIKGTNASIHGAGSCSRCEKCTYPDAPCRFPEKAFSSIEAMGVNVMKLAETVGINYINGENTVTYFTAVFCD